MRGQGHQNFVDELARFAAGLADVRVTAIAERAAAPLRVAVRGRRGVGRRTVACALNRAGLSSGILSSGILSSGILVAPLSGAPDLDDPDVDVTVYVTAEVFKPEDIDAIGELVSARHPVLGVLNKADTAGSLSGPDGPVAAAQARCAQLAALAGVPMEPMIGLLAVTALHDLDRGVWDALRALAALPGSLESVIDRFPSRQRPPQSLPQSLLQSLDMFGTALAVAALRRGATAAQVRAVLRRVSRVDTVVARVCAVGAEARYLRVLEAAAELEALSVTDEGLEEPISGFLSRDATVVARMAAAVDVAEAAGLEVGPVSSGPVSGPVFSGDPAAHLPRAAHWRRYSLGRLGPVSDLHSACGADIARGSLRLWSQTCGSMSGDMTGVPEESR